MEKNPAVTKMEKWSKKSHLWISTYPDLPVFGYETMEAIGCVLKKKLPQWSSGLTVSKNSDAKQTPVGDTEQLGKAIQSVSPLRRGLGSVIIRGAYKNICIYLSSYDGTIPPELNKITVEICSLLSVEGRYPPVWANDFLHALVENIMTRYGNAHLEEEFNVKNMVNDESGLYAIGVKLDVSLPGLYWLNYFGAPYLELIGEYKLMNAPVHSALKIGSGVMLSLDDSPFAWNSEDNKNCERKTIDYIGQEYFFNRDFPGRALVAPVFTVKR